jgi:hypothetical protein
MLGIIRFLRKIKKKSIFTKKSKIITFLCLVTDYDTIYCIETSVLLRCVEVLVAS